MKILAHKGIVTFQKILISVVWISISISCDREDPVPDVDEHYVGEVTSVGNPLGDPQEFTVDAAGATITSSDGTIQVVIPQGALTQAATITLQPVENTAPNGIGTSYRLTPEDVVFAKPVAITFTYHPDSISFEDGLGVAYQEDNGIWYWPGNVSHDKINRKVTVETTHFSSWTIFESMRLDPSYAVVAPGGEVSIRFKAVFKEEHLLTPLIEKPLPLSDFSAEADYVEGWNLIGKGALVSAGRTAKYTAPPVAPDLNPVTVQVLVSVEEQGVTNTVTLQAFVYIGQSDVALSYSTQKFKAVKEAQATYVKDLGATIIVYNAHPMNEDGTFGNEVVLVYLIVPGQGTGVKAWTPETCLVSTTHTINASTVIAGTVIVDVSGDGPAVAHPGSVTVQSYGSVGGIVSGNFSGDYTFIDSATETVSSGKVSGNFFAVRAPDI